MNNISTKFVVSIFTVMLFFLGMTSVATAATLNSLSAANNTNTFDSLNFAQTWNWSTASTQNPFSFNFNGLTSGKGISILSSATGLTGSLESISLSGNNVANTGNLLSLNQSGANSAATLLNITNSGTGKSLSVTSGTVPFVITSAGKVGIANSSPAALLTLGTAGTTAGSLSLAGLTSGTVTLQVPSVAGSNTITFPATTGTVITTGDSGTVTNGMLAGSIAASKLVGTDIATVGTITSGTWNGTTIAIANGGTGQTSASGAFDALSPMTTGGDIIYGGTSGSATRLANGSVGQYLRSSGGTSAPTWQAVLDSELSLSDITTNNVSTSAHGFVPKAPNDTTQFLRGDGSWAAPSSTTGSFVGTPFNGSSVTTQNVDTTYTPNFTAKNITIFFKLSGKVNPNVTYSSGNATYDGSTLVGTFSISNSAVAGNASVQAININTSAPSAGSTLGAGANSSATLSITSVTSTQFTVRVAYTSAIGDPATADFYVMATQ